MKIFKGLLVVGLVAVAISVFAMSGLLPKQKESKKSVEVNKEQGVLAKNEKQVAYVACFDRRIYVIDISKGKLLKVTEPIEEMGKPSCIDIDNKNGIIYISNEHHKWHISNYAIIGIDLKTMKVIKKFRLEDDIRFKQYRFSEVYYFQISPNGKKIYAMYGNPKYEKGSIIVDTSTGEILGKLNFFIGPGDVISDDGKKVTNIYPEGITVYDIEKNKKLLVQKSKELFKKGNGLNPYGKKIETPFYFIKDGKLKGISRENGEIITEITLRKEKGSIQSIYPTVTSDNKIALATLLDFNNHKYYIIGIDLIKKQVAFKVKIGKWPTNNIVLGPI